MGLHRINVDKNFDVWSGECQNDYLGNLKTEWAPLAEPTTCKQQRALHDLRGLALRARHGTHHRAQCVATSLQLL